MVFPLHFMNLFKQSFLVIDTNPVGRHVEVIEADRADQRLLPFIFTPGANDFHTIPNEQS